MALRNAQISHGFLYVLTLVIFALILLFGYKMVHTFRAKSDDLLILKFERDLQATLDSVTYGTTKIRRFPVPAGYHAFWLADLEYAFDLDTPDPGDLVGNCTRAPPEIQDALSSRTGQNAFLLGPGKLHAFTLQRINIPQGCLGTEVTGNELELRLSKG